MKANNPGNKRISIYEGRKFNPFKATIQNVADFFFYLELTEEISTKHQTAYMASLSKYIPNDRLLIAESGVRDAEDVKRLRKSNARGFLVGESVMRAENTSDAVQALVNVR